MYSTTLTKYTTRYVPAAVTAAGLPVDKVSDLMGLLAQQDTASISELFGAAVAAATADAQGQAYCKAIL